MSRLLLKLAQYLNLHKHRFDSEVVTVQYGYRTILVCKCHEWACVYHPFGPPEKFELNRRQA